VRPGRAVCGNIVKSNSVQCRECGGFCSGLKGPPSTIGDAFVSKVCERVGDGEVISIMDHRDGVCRHR